MEENKKDQGGSAEKEEVVILEIKLNIKTRRVDVVGPVQDKVMAYGMLEMGKEAIQNYHFEEYVKKMAKPAKKKDLGFFGN